MGELVSSAQALSAVNVVVLVAEDGDLLLQLVAASFKHRAITVILSGTDSGGAVGVQAIHKMGGKVIAQNEETSQFFDQASAAIATATVDFVQPVSEIAATLVNLLTSR